MRKLRKADWNIQYWYELLPWLFLLVALPITYLVWSHERDAELSAKTNQFERELNETATKLVNQLTLFELSLSAVRSLFDASTFVSESEFNNFATEILNSKFSSGLHHIGFAKLINPEQPRTFLSLEAKFKPALLRLSQSSQSPLAPVIYVVPQLHSSQIELYDAFTNNRVRHDMEISAQKNVVIVSNNIALETQGVKDCDCLSVLLPVYKRAGTSDAHSSLESEREVYGWVFLRLDLESFFYPILGSENNPAIRYALHTGLHDDAVTLIYQNAAPVKLDNDFSISRRHHIDVHGLNWTLYAYALPPFESRLSYKHSIKIGLLGLFITLALTGILFLIIARIRAYHTLKNINKRLKFSDDRWRFALEGSGDGIWDWDIENKRMAFSKRWNEMLGYEEGDLEETFEAWHKKIHPDDAGDVMKALTATLSNSGYYSIECRFKCKDNTWKWILARGMVVNRNDKSDPIRMVGTHTDISALKKSEEMIWQHANLDELTGLPNRRMLYSRLEQELEQSKAKGEKLALLFLDLDNFKEINDTLGHDQGDILLSLAAKRLLSSLHRRDVVARLGGDEFVVLVSGIETDKLSKLDVVAQKIISVLEAPFILNNERVFISSSIGISIYPDDATTIDELIKNVDQAMYASKNRGGNCYTYFTPKMQEDAANRLRLSNDLREALASNELFIEYQPIVDLQTEQVYKAEALLRWNHAERGLISPTEFVPIAENTRLINEIGYWIFVESVKQCKRWRDHIDNRFQISVNKSPVQFLNNEPKYSNWGQVLSENVLAGNAIIIEITEGLLLEASGQVEAKLKHYRENGMQVALDDFGTGYSSLSYLRKFEIDYLKIDRSFVANLEESPEDRVLCRAIIAMAHSLGIKVIAEGIETKQQRDVLFEANCDFGQGYYFARPMSASQFEAYVKK